MEKMKVVDSGWNPETGVAWTMIKTKRGKYIGEAKLHPEDKEYASRYAGNELAAQRAYANYLKDLINEKKIELKAFVDFYENLVDIKGFNFNSLESKKFRKKIYLLRVELLKLKKIRANVLFDAKKAMEDYYSNTFYFRRKYQKIKDSKGAE